MPRFSFLTLCAGVLFVGSSASHGAPISLDAVQDSSVRSGAPDANYNDFAAGDGGVFVHRVTTAANRYYGLVQFDLSDVSKQIIGAHMEFYLLPVITSPFIYGNTNNASSHEAWFLPVDVELPYSGGIDDTQVTYNNLPATPHFTVDSITMDGLGRLSLAANSPANTYYSSSVATAADLVLLNGRRTAADPDERYALFWLEPISGNRLYGDREGAWIGEGDPQPIRLVLTLVPEPSPMLLGALSAAMIALGGAGRRFGRAK